MICLKCFKTITETTRQKYKGGIKLPYCAPCVQDYLISKQIKQLNKKQRAELINKTKQELKDVKPTEEELIDAKMRLRATGFTEAEIEEITKGL
jgi:hypothetical protein